MTYCCHIMCGIIKIKNFMEDLKMSEKLIETAIKEKLTGDTQKNVLDFVAFMRENEISLNSKDGEGWAVGGIVGNSIGFMLVNGAEQMPGPWTIWFNSCDFDGVDSVDNELKEIVWAHVSPCGHCHDDWKDCGSSNRTIFGREFESLCHSPLMFTAPDAKTLESVKKLIIMSK